jgi:hypothetical protein
MELGSSSIFVGNQDQKSRKKSLDRAARRCTIGTARSGKRRSVGADRVEVPVT